MNTVYKVLKLKFSIREKGRHKKLINPLPNLLNSINKSKIV